MPITKGDSEGKIVYGVKRDARRILVGAVGARECDELESRDCLDGFCMDKPRRSGCPRPGPAPPAAAFQKRISAAKLAP